MKQKQPVSMTLWQFIVVCIALFSMVAVLIVGAALIWRLATWAF